MILSGRQKGAPTRAPAALGERFWAGDQRGEINGRSICCGWLNARSKLTSTSASAASVTPTATTARRTYLLVAIVAAPDFPSDRILAIALLRRLSSTVRISVMAT